VSITLQFSPWSPFHARKKPQEIRSWLRRVGEASEQAFKAGMRGYPPSSRPGQYPAVRTGALRASIDYEVTDDTMVIGSNAPAGGGGISYSIYLREGTSRMGGRRKMSDDALKEGMQSAGHLKKWVEWTR
jgi:phage gpG-like protein